MEQTALGLIPWNTQPQVPAQATHTITWNGGSFEIPRFGYLQASEHDFIAEIDPTNLGYSLTLEASVQLQKAIHDFDNWPPMRCYALLTIAYSASYGHKPRFTPEEIEVLSVHAALVNAYGERMKQVEQRVRTRSIAAIMRRVSPSFTDADVSSLPTELRDQIYQFEQQEERDGMGPQRAEEQLTRLEDDLGKLGEVSRSMLIVPTGDASTGNAPGSGPDEQNSAATTLDASPAGTSSKQSNRAPKPKGRASTSKNTP